MFLAKVAQVAEDGKQGSLGRHLHFVVAARVHPAREARSMVKERKCIEDDADDDVEAGEDVLSSFVGGLTLSRPYTMLDTCQLEYIDEAVVQKTADQYQCQPLSGPTEYQ